MDAARDAGQRDVVMQMCRRRDRDRVDAEVQQAFQVVDRRTAQHAGDEIALGAVGIGNSDELDAG